MSQQTVSSPSDLTIKSAFKTPAPVKFSRLQDLSTNPNDSIRYFSGTATYTTVADLKKAPKGQRMYICFNKIAAMGKVFINGKYAGGVWTTPYKLDVTDFVKDGKNDIKIEVVNTWVNRIIGDLRSPREQHHVYSFKNPYTPGSELPQSAIIGPDTFEPVPR